MPGGSLGNIGNDSSREDMERSRVKNASSLMSKFGTNTATSKPKRRSNSDVAEKIMQDLFSNMNSLDNKGKKDSDDESSVKEESSEAVVESDVSDSELESETEDDIDVGASPFANLISDNVKNQKSGRKRPVESKPVDDKDKNSDDSEHSDAMDKLHAVLTDAFDISSEGTGTADETGVIEQSGDKDVPRSSESDSKPVLDSFAEQDIDDIRGSEEAPMSAEERASRGMVAWADALSAFYTVVADDADVSRETEDTHKAPASNVKVVPRGGRAAASDKSPVQLRGISRPLFNIVTSEFPSLKNKDALEAYIAKCSGRFDLIEDDEVRRLAMRASAEDGTIAGLANEIKSMRKSLKALRIESSVASLAAIMNDVDVRSDDLSDQLFLRMRELIAISSAYDEAIRVAQGRLPHGYDD